MRHRGGGGRPNGRQPDEVHHLISSLWRKWRVLDVEDALNGCLSQSLQGENAELPALGSYRPKKVDWLGVPHNVTCGAVYGTLHPTVEWASLFCSGLARRLRGRREIDGKRRGGGKGNSVLYSFRGCISYSPVCYSRFHATDPTRPAAWTARVRRLVYTSFRASSWSASKTNTSLLSPKPPAFSFHSCYREHETLRMLSWQSNGSRRCNVTMLYRQRRQRSDNRGKSLKRPYI